MTRISPLIIVLAALFVTACASQEEPPPPIEDMVLSPPPVQALPGAPLPGRKPDPPAAWNAVETVSMRPIPPAPPQRPAFPRIKSDEVAELTPRDALVRFGKPLHVQRNGQRAIWVYVHDACRLSLHFYFSVADNQMRALDYSVEAGPEGAIPPAICLHLLARPAPASSRRPEV